MVSAILTTLPLAIGIALNPFAVVAGILMLRTARPNLNGGVYALGWLLGLLLLVAFSARLILLRSRSSREIGWDLPDVIWVAIGALLLIAAARGLRGRPLPGEEPVAPRWLRVIDTASPARVFGIGVFLATFSIRNVVLLAAAAGAIGAANLGLVELALTAAAFLAVSSIGILVPLLVRLFGGAGADVTLAAWSAWLNRNVASITAGVMGVLGAYLLVRGLTGAF